ncbi:D-alanyl-D-alanine carboxypeptidase [Metalysinibacillus saudimassiliensis]|uniref:D-alanyl-D-alanine carboxypeptidase n=1 Tax=Metalysinibacillus saudimassiliensis TaxID=1461583 RepID=A0A078MCI2_9BACL|nr:D-alanyl-D-alanine carboxypeptidase [Metalysinibacillus saudimassiliensis]
MRSRRAKEKRKKWTYSVIVTLIGLLLIGSIVVVIWQKNKVVEPNTEIVHEQPTEKLEQAPPKEVKEEPEVLDDNGYVEGQELPTEPTYIKDILIASKRYPLPKTFAPGEQPEARKAMDELIAAAKQRGFTLTAFSGYRSYDYQTTLYNNYVARDGKDAADRYSARPGYSEHQTGLVYDVGEVGKEDIWLTEQFGESEAGIWIRDNAHKYGFIMRYPKGKEDITGYMYESWHFRYVGEDIATKIAKANSTLEEYLEIK